MKMKNHKTSGFDGIPAEMWGNFSNMKETEMLMDFRPKI
jgi:hypothetical protein